MAFAAVAAVNTLVTVIVSRRRELAVLRLSGGTRGTTVRVVVCEALVMTGTALVTGVAVALATLLPMTHSVWLPASVLPAGVFLVAALVFGGLVLPAAVMLRRPPIEVAG